MQAQIDQILSESAVQDGPSVLLMITYSGGIRPKGADTMTGRMLAQLGWRNILNDYPSLLKDFSIEKVIEIDPDYILVIPIVFRFKDGNEIPMTNNQRKSPAS